MEEVIEIVDNYVYLGTTIRFNGKFHDAKMKQVIQAKKAFSAIFSQKVKLQLPLDIYLNLLDRMVLPVLMYGCEVWGYENLDILETFFRSFLKKTLKLNDQTANCMVYGESGRKPLCISIQLRMVNFWLRIITGNEKKLVFKIYSLLLKMRYIWLSPQNPNPIVIHKAIKQRLNYMFHQQWRIYISEMCS